MIQNQELIDSNNPLSKNNELYSETPQNQSSISNSNINTNNYKNISRKETLTSSAQIQLNTNKIITHHRSISSNGSSKKENINNNQENIDKELEPIMEAPPLENIIKKNDKYEFYINEPERNTNDLMFKNNTISTTKYNAFTFLPKALLYQFIRLANIYFVFIAVIQSIPIISPLGPATAIAPLVFVLAVSLIREAVEDLKRRKLDNEQNSNEVEIYNNGEWIKIQSGKLRMGEIVRVKKDGVFPSDLMLIDSNLKDGVCFIETGTLDGEKTLKIKSAPNFTKGKFLKIFDNANNNITININQVINEVKTENKNYLSQRKNSEIMTLNRQRSIESKSSGRSNMSLIPKKKGKKKKLIGTTKNNSNGANTNDNNKINDASKKSRNPLINSINSNSSNSNTNTLNSNNHLVLNSNTTQAINNIQSLTQNLINTNIIQIEGIIQCDLPNPFLYMLNGKANMRLNSIGNEFPLDAKNLLLKGAKLRNTDWIIGIVIYTGHNCKLMKNAKDPILKISAVEKLLNKLLIGILFLQILLSIIGSICHSLYYKSKNNIIISSSRITDSEIEKNTWIDYLPLKLVADSALSFFTILLLLNTMIPISLIVTLELVKIFQGLFIGFDVKSYSFNRKKYITTNSVSLNEELGMVDYIFSDKTGLCNRTAMF